MHQIVTTVRPDEIYNLGAQSHVKTSFDTSECAPRHHASFFWRNLTSVTVLPANADTGEVDALGVTRLLNAIRAAGLEKTTRFYQVRRQQQHVKAQACASPVTDGLRF